MEIKIISFFFFGFLIQSAEAFLGVEAVIGNRKESPKWVNANLIEVSREQ